MERGRIRTDVSEFNSSVHWASVLHPPLGVVGGICTHFTALLDVQSLLTGSTTLVPAHSPVCGCSCVHWEGNGTGIGSEGRICTGDLLGMNQASYYCSTSLIWHLGGQLRCLAISTCSKRCLQGAL